jgi:hypothetical protein
MSYKRILAVLITILMTVQVIPFGNLSINQCNDSFAAKEISSPIASGKKVTETPIPMETPTSTPTSTDTQSPYIKIELDKTTADVG